MTAKTYIPKLKYFRLFYLFVKIHNKRQVWDENSLPFCFKIKKINTKMILFTNQRKSYDK